MPILNYTTKVPAAQTIQQIQRILVKHGAKSFLLNYDGELPSGLAFIVPTSHGDIPFRLPVNIKAVKEVMEYQGVALNIPFTRASNVAWRIQKDWIEAQLALIEAELVTLEQVFLPYMLMPGQNHITLYDAIVQKGFYLTEGNSS